MEHISKINGKKYDIMAGVEPKTNKSYDITIIMDFGDDPNPDDDKVILIGWYFGEYDFNITESYINEWLEK